MLRYLVTHETVHLVIPDHSVAKFWLTVQSLCLEAERAKQWLRRHHAQLTVSLDSVLQAAAERSAPSSARTADIRSQPSLGADTEGKLP